MKKTSVCVLICSLALANLSVGCSKPPEEKLRDYSDGIRNIVQSDTNCKETAKKLNDYCSSQKSDIAQALTTLLRRDLEADQKGINKTAVKGLDHAMNEHNKANKNMMAAPNKCKGEAEVEAAIKACFQPILEVVFGELSNNFQKTGKNIDDALQN